MVVTMVGEGYHGSRRGRTRKGRGMTSWARLRYFGVCRPSCDACRNARRGMETVRTPGGCVAWRADACPSHAFVEALLVGYSLHGWWERKRQPYRG